MFFREKSRVLASRKRADEVLGAQYLDRKGARKRFTMKISNKKSAHRSKGVGFIKNHMFLRPVHRMIFLECADMNHHLKI